MDDDCLSAYLNILGISFRDPYRVGVNKAAVSRVKIGRRPMKCIIQLVGYDDWLLWYIFVNNNIIEARAEIVRGKTTAASCQPKCQRNS